MSLSIGLTLQEFSDLAAFQSGLELFVLQPEVDATDIETTQAAYRLIQTTEANPDKGGTLQQRFLESALRDPKIAQVFMRALALKPSSGSQYSRRFATHFSADVFVAHPSKGTIERFQLLNKNPQFPVIIPHDRTTFLDGLSHLSRVSPSIVSRAKLIIIGLNGGEYEVRLLRIEDTFDHGLLPGERFLFKGTILAEEGKALRLSDNRLQRKPLPDEAKKMLVALLPPETVIEGRENIFGSATASVNEVCDKVRSVEDAFRLATRERNMFAAVRMKDGSIVMRAGANSHAAMIGEDDPIATGWYGVEEDQVQIQVHVHVDDREGDISNTEIDRLIRSQVFPDDTEEDFVTIKFNASQPASAQMEERLRILRRANWNDHIYIPKDRRKLFEAAQIISEQPTTHHIKGVIVEMTDGQSELRLMGDDQGTHHNLVLLGEKMVWRGSVAYFPEDDFLSFRGSYSVSDKIKTFLRKKFGDCGIEP